MMRKDNKKIVMGFLKYVFESYCNYKKWDPEMCKDCFDGVLGIMVNKSFDLVNPNTVCYSVGLCNSPKVRLDPNKPYINRVLRNRPPKLNVPANSGKKPIRFLAFADVHADYLYQEVKPFILTTFIKSHTNHREH